MSVKWIFLGSYSSKNAKWGGDQQSSALRDCQKKRTILDFLPTWATSKTIRHNCTTTKTTGSTTIATESTKMAVLFPLQLQSPTLHFYQSNTHCFFNTSRSETTTNIANKSMMGIVYLSHSIEFSSIEQITPQTCRTSNF